MTGLDAWNTVVFPITIWTGIILYYPGMDGEKMERVYPAALLDGNEWACNAPNGTKEQFYESLDRHPECWEVQNDPVDATHYSCGGGPEGHGSTFLDNNYAGDYG